MKATELPYGKFQTAIFKLAQELGENGAEAVSRLDTDPSYRARVAKYLATGAPSQVLVTSDEHKAALLEGIEKLEKARGLTPALIGGMLQKIREQKKDFRAQNAFQDYWDWSRKGWDYRGGDLDFIAKILGTTKNHLKRISQRFEQEVKLEFDPRLEIKAILSKVPDNVNSLGQFFLWLSEGGNNETA